MNWWAKHQTWAGPVLSGLGLCLAFPPFNIWPLVFVALVPWFLSAKDLTRKSAFRTGYLFGFVFGLGQMHWLGGLVESWVGSFLLGLIPWFVATSLFAIYFGLLGLLLRGCQLRQWLWLFPLVWAGMEIIRCYMPVLAFPWALMAYPLAHQPWLIQGAHYGFVVWVSAGVVAVNLALSGAPRKPLSVLAMLFLLAPTLRMMDQGQTAHRATVAAVQTGVNLATTEDPSLTEAKLRSSLNRTLEHLHRTPDLIVLPEGIARGKGAPPPEMPFNLPKAPVLFGGQRVDPTVHQTFQSAFAYDGRWQVADKTRLVIFGEFVPGRDYLPFLQAFNLPSGDLSAGNHVGALTIGKLRVGPLLCFEGLFPDLAYREVLDGAQVSAVMSIDDWFTNGSAPELLRDAAVWRAIETGHPLIRAGSLGYTRIYNRFGVPTAEVPFGQPVAAEGMIDLGKNDFFPPIIVFPILSLLALAAVAVPKKSVQKVD